MNILINGFSLNDPSNRVYLDENIEGLELTPIRTSSGLNSGQDGGYVGAQNRDMRSVTLPGHVFSANVSEARRKRRELQDIFLLYPEVNEVEVEDDDGSVYLFYAQLIDFKMPIKRDRLKSLFKIELLAPDPILYDNSTGGELSVALSRYSPAGFSWPISWPLAWPASTGVVTATNNGKAFVLPRIELSGVMTDPIITNQTTGQYFQLQGITTVAGDVIVIDMQKRTVTLNGGNIFNKKKDGSEWWGLPVGDSDIKFETSGGGSSPTGLLLWRDGVMGI